MSILDSTIAPYLIILAIFAVLVGFFRKIFLKVVIILLVQALLFALFPALLKSFVNLVTTIHNSL